VRRFLLILVLMTWGCATPESTAARKAVHDRFVEHDRILIVDCRAMGGFAQTRWEEVALPVEGYLAPVVVRGFLFQSCQFPPSFEPPAALEAL
jgi:hypothetical protein